MSDFVSAFMLLVLVVDPVGNVPFVVRSLARVDPSRHGRIVLRECAVAYGMLLFFLWAGEHFLRILGLSREALTIAGGVILLMIAVRMVFGKGAPFGSGPDAEPLVVPIATPYIAGPSAIATVMLVGPRDAQHLTTGFLAITAVMILTALVLLAGERLLSRFGERAMYAVERLMGLLLTAIAVQMLLTGVEGFVRGLAAG